MEAEGVQEEWIHDLKKQAEPAQFENNFVRIQNSEELQAILEYLQQSQTKADGPLYPDLHWAVVGHGQGHEFQVVQQEYKPLHAWEQQFQENQEHMYYNGIVQVSGDQVFLTQSWVVIDREPVSAIAPPLSSSWIFFPEPSAPPLEEEEKQQQLQIAEKKEKELLIREEKKEIPKKEVVKKAPPKPGLFDNWPTFHVGSKLKVVADASKDAMVFGFTLGAKTALEILITILKQEAIKKMTPGAAIAAAVSLSVAPKVFLTGLGYVVFGLVAGTTAGGLVVGAAAATPVFIVGTTGVFVSATVYHSFELAKRVVYKAVNA